MERPTPKAAIARLREVRRPRAAYAIERLMGHRSTSAPARLFREMFPREFAEFERNPEEHAKSWLGKMTVPQLATYRFCELLDGDYFPATEGFDFFLDGTDEWHVPGVLIGHYQSIEWWNDEVDHYPSALRLGCLLFGALTERTEQELWATLAFPEGAGMEIASARFLNVDILERLCARERGPSRYFLTALRVLDHGTANVWIDITSESNIEYIAWERDELEEHRRLWKAAERMWTQVGLLSKWIDEDEATRIPHLLRMWERATPSPERTEQ